MLEGKGAFSSGNDTEKAIEAQLHAAFNRHVMEEPNNKVKVVAIERMPDVKVRHSFSTYRRLHTVAHRIIF